VTVTRTQVPHDAGPGPASDRGPAAGRRARCRGGCASLAAAELASELELELDVRVTGTARATP
jgi:hypothetical protein